jgi:hypothetical protein
VEVDACADACRDRSAASTRRPKPPRKHAPAGLLGERLDAVDHHRIGHGSIGLDGQIEKDDGVAVRARRVGNVGAALSDRRGRRGSRRVDLDRRLLFARR